MSPFTTHYAITLLDGRKWYFLFALCVFYINNNNQTNTKITKHRYTNKTQRGQGGTKMR